MSTGWIARRVAAWGRPEPDATARLLQPLALLYGALSGLRRLAYRRGWLRTEHAPVPVLVVGNLIVGGAGKTPTVVALVPRLRAMGFHPGIVSRGHGRQAQGVQAVTPTTPATESGDEPLLLHLRTGAPVFVDRDRVAAARALCAAHPEVNLILADDGLQHLRLARDAQLLVFDDRGVGNGLLLPAGPLRQPLPPLAPARGADAIATSVPTRVLYTGGRRSTPLPGCVGHRSLLAPRRLADWWVDAQGVAATRGDRDGDLAASALHGDWSAWQGRAVIACAGLARPQAFFEQLAALGLQVDGRPLPDHDALHNPPWDDAATDVLVTEKDAVKLDPRSPRNARVWVVALDFRPEPAFEAELHDLCTPLLPPERGDTAIATPHEP